MWPPTPVTGTQKYAFTTGSKWHCMVPSKPSTFAALQNRRNSTRLPISMALLCLANRFGMINRYMERYVYIVHCYILPDYKKTRCWGFTWQACNAAGNGMWYHALRTNEPILLVQEPQTRDAPSTVQTLGFNPESRIHNPWIIHRTIQRFSTTVGSNRAS